MSNTSKKISILITGATGTIGSELARLFIENGISFRAMIRTAGKSGQLTGSPYAEEIYGDFNDPDSLKKALNGIEKVFLLTNSTEFAEKQQIDLVDAAVAAGVKHIVKLSQFAADLHSPVRYLRYHAAVEQRIIGSGINYTFLRPNLFMQGLLLFSDTIIHQGKFFAPAGEAKISLVDIRDIAAVAYQALTQPGHENKSYDITGPQALTHGEIASLLSEVTGKTISYIDVTPDDMRRALASLSFPKWQAEGLLEDYAHYSRGEAALISNDVKRVTGNEPRSFKTFAQDNAASFVPAGTPS